MIRARRYKDEKSPSFLHVYVDHIEKEVRQSKHGQYMRQIFFKRSSTILPLILMLCLIITVRYYFHISHVYIYDNKDNFELNGWLDRRPRLTNKVTIHHYPGEMQQSPAYRDCGVRYATNHQWVAYFDVDEYLVIREYTNVIEFLLRYAPIDGQLSLNQERMSSYSSDDKGERSSMNYYTPQPVTKRFQESHDIFRAVKSIVNVKSIANADHHPHFASIQIDTSGNQIEPVVNLELAPAMDGRSPTPWNMNKLSDVATLL